MKFLIVLFSSFVLFGCGTLTSIQERKQASKLVAIPFGEHDLLMALKDSAYVNDCLMSDSSYYLKHINQNEYTAEEELNNRQILRIPDLSEVMLARTGKSTTIFLICSDAEGIPKFSKFLHTTSNDKELVRKMHHLTLNYKYSASLEGSCLECGRFTFKLGLDN